MPAKDPSPHPFAIGEACIVRNLHTGKVVDNGIVDALRPMGIVFRSALDSDLRFYFRRKGAEWIELKKDHYRLEVPS